MHAPLLNQFSLRSRRSSRSQGTGITALTLSWESLDFLPRLIESTLRWADRFYILDTGSSDGSRQYLHEQSRIDSRIKYFTVDTDHTTFNRGRCINLLLDQIDADDVRSDWLAIIDCDEIFEKDFVDHSLPMILKLPRSCTEVSFQRPTLWYSDTLARAHDIDFREPAFQRYRSGFRYPEKTFHMSRSMRRPSVTFMSNALLFNYELRDPNRSRLQYERLKLIDKEWNHLLRSPDDPPELVEISPMHTRGGENSQVPSVDIRMRIRNRMILLPRHSRTRRVARFIYRQVTSSKEKLRSL